MSYKIQRQASQILLRIQDDLTIAEVKVMWEELLAAVSDPLPVVVDAGEAKRVDISILQVLYSVSKSIAKLTVQDCSPPVRDYLLRAGVSLDAWGHASSDRLPVNGAGNG